MLIPPIAPFRGDIEAATAISDQIYRYSRSNQRNTVYSGGNISSNHEFHQVFFHFIDLKINEFFHSY